MPGNKHQDVPEHEPRHGDLVHLERHVTAMADDLRADLDQLLAQAGQRPRFGRLRHRQRPHEISHIIGEDVKLEVDGIGGEGAARQPRPLYRALPLFDPLLSRAALVVEGDDSLGRTSQVRDDEADARVQLAPDATRSWPRHA